MRQFRTFRVGLEESGADGINRFLRNVRVIAIDKKFVEVSEGSFWVFLVEYEVAQDNAHGRRERVDYEQVMSGSKLELFNRLRKLRHEFSIRDAVPAYAVFTNEMAERMLEIKELTLVNLQTIEGFGKARAEKYGAQILQVLLEGQGHADAVGADLHK